jgi:hypothetical protein
MSAKINPCKLSHPRTSALSYPAYEGLQEYWVKKRREKNTTEDSTGRTIEIYYRNLGGDKC